MMRLDHKLSLERKTRKPDGAGGAQINWQAIDTLWGGVSPGAARGATGDAFAISHNSFTVTVRALPFNNKNRPRAGDRFIWGASRRLFIEAVQEADEKGKFLRIFTTQEIAQ